MIKANQCLQLTSYGPTFRGEYKDVVRQVVATRYGFNDDKQHNIRLVNELLSDPDKKYIHGEQGDNVGSHLSGLRSF
jgi:hypothetical protein